MSARPVPSHLKRGDQAPGAPPLPAGVSRADLARAADGDVRLAWEIGRRYAARSADARDDREAVEWFTIAAEAELADAQFALAEMFGAGRGVPRDDRRRAVWLERAAAHDHADALFHLALAHHEGRGVPQDDVAAVRRLERAAVRQDPRAQNQLGWHYYKGWGVERHDGWAAYWCREAAEAGDRDGLDSLAYFYEHGIGVGRDFSRALELYRLAEAAGHRYPPGRLEVLQLRAAGVEVPEELLREAEASRDAAPSADERPVYAMLIGEPSANVSEAFGPGANDVASGPLTARGSAHSGAAPGAERPETAARVPESETSSAPSDSISGLSDRRTVDVIRAAQSGGPRVPASAVVPADEGLSDRLSVTPRELALARAAVRESLPDGPTPAQTRDRLMRAAARHRAEGDYERALELLSQLEGVDAPLPAGFDFYFGESLVLTGNPETGRIYLERYVNRGGLRGRYYERAVALLDGATEIPAE